MIDPRRSSVLDARGWVYAGLAVVVWLAPIGHVSAEPLPKAEQTCTLALDRGVEKLVGALAKNASDCIRSYGKDKVEKLGPEGSVESCLLAHPKGAAPKALGKLEDQFDKKCADPDDLPSFEPNEPLATGFVALVKQPMLVHAIFGSDLASGIVREAEDRSAARCQQALAKEMGRCQTTLLKAYGKCKKEGLKNGDIVDPAGLASCIGEDPKGKIAKACDDPGGADRIHVALDTKCEAEGVDLAAALPGCQSQDAEQVQHCIASRVRCNACQLLNQADGLARDCDDFDDGLGNATCGCGDGIEDPTLYEECDDGNTADGDGCSSGCLVEFCGDDVVNDAPNEQCDDGGNADEDGCSASCLQESCGDGVLQTGAGEICDDGDLVEDNGCDNDCAPSDPQCVCDCDDGNPCTEENCVLLPQGCVCIVVPLTNLGCCEGMAVDPATQGLCNNSVYKKADSCCEMIAGQEVLLKKNPIKKLNQCPNRVANPGWQIQYDGCSSVPNQPVPGFHFSNAAHTGPCDVHDACYQTCNSVKQNCEDQFLTNMLAVCDGVPGAAAKDAEKCKKMANTYQQGVILFGSNAFDLRQREVCNCCM